MKNREPLFPGNYEPLPLDSNERPIKVVGTHRALVPEGAERFLEHYVDDVEFPNGNKGLYHRVWVPSGAMVAHVDDDDKVALVKNFRHVLGRDSVELPSGGIDENESSLLVVFTPEEAAKIVRRAREKSTSIMALLRPDEAEEVIIDAARRETSEEIGLDIDPEHIVRLTPRGLRAAVSVSGHEQNIFYATDGRPVPTKHDDGEAGILKTRRFSIEDASEMEGYEIVDPATAAAVSALAHMYGVKPSWLPAVQKSRKHIV